jgi:anti-sigma regulatory factor (Ser/Thr protein kinase)
MTSLKRSFAPEAGAVPNARGMLSMLDSELPHGVAEDARLLVSELVTNSIRHADLQPDQSISVHLHLDGSVLRVTIAHPGGGFAYEPRRIDSAPDSGWGLFLVNEIADRWGVSGDGGTTVWFELDLRGSMSRGRASDIHRDGAGPTGSAQFEPMSVGYLSIQPHGGAEARWHHGAAPGRRAGRAAGKRHWHLGPAGPSGSRRQGVPGGRL